MFIIGTIVCIIIICIIICTTTKFNNNNRWIAPSKTNVNNIIDNALYFQNLNKLDLIARHVNSKDEYITQYKQSLNKFSKAEASILNDLIKDISMNYTYKYQKLQQIPWKFVKFNGVEENFPHTISDIIFLPQDFFYNSKDKQIETLIHEKIHIYQRLYTIETAKLIALLGFSIWNTQEKFPNIRTNPDTNSFIYKYGEGDNISAQAQIYNNDTPESIKDSHISLFKGEKIWNVPECIKQPDHPYEIMACALAHLIMNNLSDEYDYKKNILSWSNEFL
jgi:hypothetical protein